MHIKRVIIVCVSFAILMTLVLVMYSDTVFLYKPLARGAVSALTPAKNLEFSEFFTKKHSEIVKEFIAGLKNLNLSGLGKYLFLNSKPPGENNKTFKILIWKDGDFLEKRHIRHFSTTNNDPFDPLRCSVHNCKLTYEEADLKDADAVAFLLHRLKVEDLPATAQRPSNQRWVFISDESPRHTFLYAAPNNTWKDYNGIFNWSMTYRIDSDVPVPYGRTIALKEEMKLPGKALSLDEQILTLVPNMDVKQRDVLVSAMLSNCGKNNRRLDYIKELQKYMKVDVYGACGDELKDACPGHFGVDCPLLNKYLFHLAFENSNCDQYFTEKVYWNSYSKGAVPVILGPKTNCSRLMLPPDSAINTWDFARPVDLARYILFMNATWDEEFFIFHNWRRHFEISNEHGYFGSPSFHYCRLCEALNFNDEEPKVYSDLSDVLDIEKNCHYTADWELDIEKQ